MSKSVRYTCPLIDKVIVAIEQVNDENFDYRYVCSILEDIRAANQTLRDNWGEEENAREVAEAGIHELEQEIDRLKEKLEAAAERTVQ